MTVSGAIVLGILFAVIYIVAVLVLYSNDELTTKVFSLLSIILFCSSGFFLWVYLAYQLEIITEEYKTPIATIISDDGKDSQSKVQVAIISGEVINVTKIFNRIYADDAILKITTINNVRGGLKFEDSSISYSVLSGSKENFPNPKETKNE